VDICREQTLFHRPLAVGRLIVGEALRLEGMPVKPSLVNSRAIPVSITISTAETSTVASPSNSFTHIKGMAFE
jgi:hypothetical protein